MLRVRLAVWGSGFLLRAELHVDSTTINISRGMMGVPEQGFLPVFGQTLAGLPLRPLKPSNPASCSRDTRPLLLQCTTRYVLHTFTYTHTLCILRALTQSGKPNKSKCLVIELRNS